MHLSVQESSGRGTLFLAYRSAILELWGEHGWTETVLALPPESRQALVDTPVAPVGWVPERHMMALVEAIFTGPAGGSHTAFVGLLDEMIDQGFGRVRSFLVRFAPPRLVLTRAAELWRHDHTEGELVVSHGENSALVEVRGHIYATHETSRLTAAETFRIILSRTRAKNVACSHRLLGDRVLEVSLSWT